MKVAKSISIYLKVILVASLVIISFVGKTYSPINLPISKIVSDNQEGTSIVVSDDFQATISFFDINFTFHYFAKALIFFVPTEIFTSVDNKHILTKYIQKRILCCKISPTNAP